MKTLIALILFLAVCAHAQTNAAPTNAIPDSALAMLTTSSPLRSAVEQDLKSVFAATNWVIAPYATYGLDGAEKGKVGGGVLVGYDFTENVGAFFAGDYLGKFSLFSGQLQLKLPIHPFTSLTNFVVEPNVFTGIGLNGEIVAGGGAAVSLFKTGSVKWGLDAEYEKVSNAGAQSGSRANVALVGRLGF